MIVIHFLLSFKRQQFPARPRDFAECYGGITAGHIITCHWSWQNRLWFSNEDCSPPI